MKCPLRNTTSPYPDGQVGIDTWDCLKEECAWWDSQDKRCGLMTIAGCLKTHLGWMGDLVDKMPHEEQFRELKR